MHDALAQVGRQRQLLRSSFRNQQGIRSGRAGDANQRVNPFCRDTLVVDAQQVALGQAEAADRCSAVDAAVRTLPVVAEQEGGQFGAALVRGVVGAGA